MNAVVEMPRGPKATKNTLHGITRGVLMGLVKSLLVWSVGKTLEEVLARVKLESKTYPALVGVRLTTNNIRSCVKAHGMGMSNYKLIVADLAMFNNATLPPIPQGEKGEELPPDVYAKTVYVSCFTGRQFDTPEEAVAHDEMCKARELIGNAINASDVSISPIATNALAEYLAEHFIFTPKV